MSTDIGQIVAPAPAWPHQDTANLASLIDRLLRAADGLSSHANERYDAGACSIETLSPAQIRDGTGCSCCLDDTGQDVDTDPLAPTHGIVAGLVLSVPLWALIGLGVWLIV
jgi:hypothetical protein